MMLSTAPDVDSCHCCMCVVQPCQTSFSHSTRHPRNHQNQSGHTNIIIYVTSCWCISHKKLCHHRESAHWRPLCHSRPCSITDYSTNLSLQGSQQEKINFRTKFFKANFRTFCRFHKVQNTENPYILLAWISHAELNTVQDTQRQ